MAIKDKYKVERKYITNKLARGGKKLVSGTPRYFVAHETANNSADADAHYKYFQGIKFQASAHTFIDDKKILEIIPTNEKAWHVQYNQDKRTLGLGYANDYAVGTELCRTGSFADAYDRYVWYHAYLCHKYGKQPKKHITAHKFEDPARRSDPQSWLEPNGVTWDEFINDVQAYYVAWDGKASDTPKEEKPAATKPKKDKPYTVDAQWPKLENYGPNVGKWQRKLKTLGYYKGEIDNSFGPATHKATIAFQRAHNLAVDGQAGPKSNAAADKAIKAKNQKQTVHLPKTASSWRVYPTNKAPTKGNEKGYLNPKKFGGISYEILGKPQADVVTIQTRDFGKVNIFVGKGTGAVIK